MRYLHFHCSLCGVLALLAICSAGCGSGYSERAPVQGSVTFNGQPVTTGTIIFYPELGRSAVGKIQPDGTYSLTTNELDDGALLGKHAVTIKSTAVPDSFPAMPESFEEELKSGIQQPTQVIAPITWLVPEKYADRATSPLTAVVEPKVNTIDFHLKLDPIRSAE